MKRPFFFSLVVVAALPLVHCSDEGSSQPKGGSDSGPDVVQKDAGKDAAKQECDSGEGALASVAGSWKVLGSSGARGVEGTIEIAADHLSIAFGGEELNVTLPSGTSPLKANWQNGSHQSESTGTRTAGAFNGGAFPIPLGGEWQLGTSPSATCNATVSADNFTSTCANVAGKYTWINGTATAHRTRTLPSVFGDLGGEWTVSGKNGEACTFTFSGQKFEAACSSKASGARLEGSADILFCRSKASGTLSRGEEHAEFSATLQ